MKIFKHKKQIDNTFDIVHLSGPKDNYNITESMGTLIYTGKDNKNKYELNNKKLNQPNKNNAIINKDNIIQNKFLSNSIINI